MKLRGRPQKLCMQTDRWEMPVEIIQALYNDLVLIYNALPSALLPPTAQKRVIPKALRAAATALPQASKLADLLFDAAEAALETTLPRLFFISLSLVSPPTVFTLVPRKTALLALLPRAILEVVGLPLFMAFMPFVPFMTFIGNAMAMLRRFLLLKKRPVNLEPK
eukprot:CAMPEP_0204590578 /NCGR_PEP_ID=MMETSP0661-20131031/49870_1 /ASSEMBLY_ACC=CAM_ASM_000606 /TAXON_ID=109239 /ORGANISM="Alexandrium margalefi, Strain AMGDE01CS-322" /LENGTH=164 /DNA_ID=CAMNT_0051600621 /DNA_START=27 /DNA_END=518 /DNA_ORIENTATION=-